MGDQLGDPEDQLGRRRLLHPLSVQVERDPDGRGVADLVGGDEGGTAGGGAVEDLAGDPLRRGELQVASREVVEQHVPGDVVERVGLTHRRRLGADHECDLGLVVHLVAGGGEGDRRPVGNESVGELGEEGGHGRGLVAGLGRVVAVVEPDADDLLRIRHRRQQLDPGQRDRGRGICSRLLEPLELTGGEDLAHGRGPVPERIAGIDELPTAQNAGANATLGEIAGEVHARHPKPNPSNSAEVGSRRIKEEPADAAKPAVRPAMTPSRRLPTPQNGSDGT